MEYPRSIALSLAVFVIKRLTIFHLFSVPLCQLSPPEETVCKKSSAMSTRISRSAIIQTDTPTPPTVSKYFPKRKAASSKRLTSAETNNKKARTRKMSDPLTDILPDISRAHLTLVANSVVTSLPLNVNAPSVELPLSQLNRCYSGFYDVPCQDLAKRLLGT